MSKYVVSYYKYRHPSDYNNLKDITTFDEVKIFDDFDVAKEHFRKTIVSAKTPFEKMDLFWLAQINEKELQEKYWEVIKGICQDPFYDHNLAADCFQEFFLNHLSNQNSILRIIADNGWGSQKMLETNCLAAKDDGGTYYFNYTELWWATSGELAYQHCIFLKKVQD